MAYWRVPCRWPTIEFASVIGDTVTLRGAAFVKDDAGVPRWLRVTRTQLPPDLREARIQILGFHADDPVTLPATTALGPSLAVVEELRDAGKSDVVVATMPRAATTRAYRERRHGALYLVLSGRRAAALKRALVERHGIAEPRLRTEGFGFSRRLEPNTTPEGRTRDLTCAGSASASDDSARRRGSRTGTNAVTCPSLPSR